MLVKEIKNYFEWFKRVIFSQEIYDRLDDEVQIFLIDNKFIILV